MKMIASTKLVRAQKAMDAGRAFIAASQGPFLKEQQQQQPADTPIVLLLVCSSDKGLCGAIHSSLSRKVKGMLQETSQSPFSLVVIGDKCRVQLAKACSNRFAASFGGIGKNAPTFREASEIAQRISSQLQLSTASPVHILSNHFQSVLVYESRLARAPSMGDSDLLRSYEVSEAQLSNYFEFLRAVGIFSALVEGHAAEMAAKRTSMESAAKNAGEIINGLTIRYNRTRQAVITNELIDIITGASAL